LTGSISRARALVGRGAWPRLRRHELHRGDGRFAPGLTPHC
jgi:hypothetical protein